MELLAILVILLITAVVSYAFGRVALESVILLMQRGEQAVNRISRA